jgi:hypothetical protein
VRERPAPRSARAAKTAAAEAPTAEAPTATAAQEEPES